MNEFFEDENTQAVDLFQDPLDVSIEKYSDFKGDDVISSFGMQFNVVFKNFQFHSSRKFFQKEALQISTKDFQDCNFIFIQDLSKEENSNFFELLNQLSEDEMEEVDISTPVPINRNLKTQFDNMANNEGLTQEIFSLTEEDEAYFRETEEKYLNKLEKESCMNGNVNIEKVNNIQNQTDMMEDVSFGFQTGNGKKFEPSKEAKKKAEKFLKLNDLEEEDSSGFQTANGKQFKVSKEAKQKAEKILNIGNDVTKIDHDGFRTGNGKNFKISEKSKKKAEKFLELNFDDIIQDDIIEDNEGFQTGKGKKINISNDAKEKAKQFLGNIEEIEEESSSLFQTGNGKKFNISDDAKVKAKKMFNLDEEKEEEECGFQTGKGKKYTVSKEAKEKAEKFMNCENEDVIKESDIGGLFQTGNGKKFNISDDAKKKAKKILGNIEEIEEESSSLFQTGKGKKFNTSKESIEKAQKFLLQEVSSPKPFTPPPKPLEEKKRKTMSKGSPFKKPTLKKFKSPLLKNKKVMIEKEENKKVEEKNYQRIKIFEIKKKEKRKKLKDINEMFNQFEREDLNSFSWISSTISENFKFKKIKNEIKELMKEEWMNEEKEEYGYEEIKEILIKYGGNENMITNDWIKNHYRLIIWKLSSYEKRFPIQYQNYFSFFNCLKQMIYRYNLEIVEGKRSVIRKITEKDESSERYLILCISKIINDDFIELTDGWYFIFGKLDFELKNLLKLSKLKEGQKLKILNSKYSKQEEDGNHPLDIPINSRMISNNGCSIVGINNDDKIINPTHYLNLNINSIRISKWFEPLGLQMKLPFLISLNSIKSKGGIIPCIEVIVNRKYPNLFIGKSLNQTFRNVIRTQKSQDISQDLWKKKQSEKFENLKLKFEKDERNELNLLLKTPIKRCFNKIELCKRYYFSNDKESFFFSLSQKQQNIIKSDFENFKREKEKELFNLMQSEIQDQNNSFKMSQFFSIRVLDQKMNEKLITIWSPTLDSNEILKEGNIVRIFNLFPSDFNSNLESKKQTKYQLLKSSSKIEKSTHFIPRSIISFENLKSFHKNDEFDTIGIVFRIDKLSQYVKHIFVTNENNSFLMIELKESDSKEIHWSLQEFECYSFLNLNML
eukprot:gene4439-7814_t